MARENRSWGNVLRRHGLPPAPERKRTTTWVEFIGTHLALLAATDFFTVEVLTWRGLVTYYVLFFIHLAGALKGICGIFVSPVIITLLHGRWLDVF